MGLPIHKKSSIAGPQKLGKRKRQTERDTKFREREIKERDTKLRERERDRKVGRIFLKSLDHFEFTLRPKETVLEG